METKEPILEFKQIGGFESRGMRVPQGVMLRFTTVNQATRGPGPKTDWFFFDKAGAWALMDILRDQLGLPKVTPEGSA